MIELPIYLNGRKMIIYYRISNNSYVKPKLSNATKRNCLINFMKEFGENINIIADNINHKLYSEIKDLILHIDNFEQTNLGNAGSFRYVLDKAVNLNDNEIVLFQEDDYLYLPNSKNCIIEGLEIADYVSLYDHPDKYISASRGGNPYIDGDNGEKTKVYLTKSTHWKLANSTTMTFASKVSTLKEDKKIWDRYISGDHPLDYQAFCELIQFYKRKLITSIPGKSTHCEIDGCSPLINWNII